jgi:hypothetical protein
MRNSYYVLNKHGASCAKTTMIPSMAAAPRTNLLLSLLGQPLQFLLLREPLQLQISFGPPTRGMKRTAL